MRPRLAIPLEMTASRVHVTSGTLCGGADVPKHERDRVAHPFGPHIRIFAGLADSSLGPPRAIASTACGNSAGPSTKRGLRTLTSSWPVRGKTKAGGKTKTHFRSACGPYLMQMESRRQRIQCSRPHSVRSVDTRHARVSTKVATWLPVSSRVGSSRRAPRSSKIADTFQSILLHLLPELLPVSTSGPSRIGRVLRFHGW